MPATIRDAHIKWCRGSQSLDGYLCQWSWTCVGRWSFLIWQKLVFNCLSLMKWMTPMCSIRIVFCLRGESFFRGNWTDILDWKLTVAHSPHNPLRDESEIMIVKYVELLKLAHYPFEFDSGKEACLEREKRELDAQKTGKTVCIHVFWKIVERSYACVRSRPFFFRKAWLRSMV